MIIKNVFFDANIFNDIFDKNRPSHTDSNTVYLDAIRQGITIYTSCDIVTNIYYITAKYTTRENALNAVDLLKTSVSIIPFGEEELSQAIALMRHDNDYKDFEDTIQYILAKNSQCGAIVTNDSNFMAKDITGMTPKIFIETYL